MLKMLGKPASINVRKVLWTCAEIGVQHELDAWGAGAQPTADPAFLRLNPNGLVPVIVDQGVARWESNAICRYLRARHQRLDLLPAEPMARAQLEKWMDWQVSELNPAWRCAFMALVRRSPAHADPALVAASVAEWTRLMVILDARLAASGAYVGARAFTYRGRYRARPVGPALDGGADRAPWRRSMPVTRS